ncbi:DUF2934 domain-containing protein [uncultured Thiodictyon sp.]|uniref:DUF2934 domain-containing protein n=1 Tax=uncultured Thiodictyon sp. TaxID=1846217 RepID=UPI0025DEE55C|nr:DUF2934 domain-containing protein [uncultured Thiodictyon sp.]
MASLQTVERPAKRRGNGGQTLFATPPAPKAAAAPLTDDLSQAITEAAYYRAEARGFEPGHELEDWVAAEQDVIAYHYPVGEAERESAPIEPNVLN